MLFWFFQQIIISLTLILLIHYLYVFFKNNLTEPKVKDLVNKPMKRYMEMYQTIDNPTTDNPMTDNPMTDNQNNSSDNHIHMKNELKNYLQTLTSKKTDPMSANDLNTNYQTL